MALHRRKYQELKETVKVTLLLDQNDYDWFGRKARLENMTTGRYMRKKLLEVMDATDGRS